MINHNIFEFAGMEVLPPFILYGAADFTPAGGKEEIARYERVLEGL